MAAFEEMGVMPELIRAVEELGWQLPTPVQSEAVPLILGGGDVMAAAETGSGKTGAFALPIVQIVHETIVARQRGLSGGGSCHTDAAGEPRKCVLSAEDRDPLMAITPDGLRCQARSAGGWAGCRGSVGTFRGRVYWEATVADEGLCRVGWATRAAKLDIGTDRHSFGFGGTGKKSHAGRFEEYGRAYGQGDVIGCMLDHDAGAIAFLVNGEALGEAFALPPFVRGHSLFPAVSLKNAELALNFGGRPFHHAPPPRFVALDQAPASWTSTASNDTPRVAAATEEAAAEVNAAAAGNRAPAALVLEPTRELAEQTHAAVGQLLRFLGPPPLRPVLLVGGDNPKHQAAELAAGADIVTGTVARVKDMVESGKLALGGVKFFVIDEADRLLDTGNQPDILHLFNLMPKGAAGAARLQVLLFSATLHSPEVRAVAERLCQNPTLVDLKGREAVPDTVDHVRVVVDPREDRSWLQSTPHVATDGVHAFDTTGPNASSAEAWSEAVKRLKPRILHRIIDAYKMEQCLVFCRTNLDCDNLEAFLNALSGGRAWTGRRETGKENPYSCVVLGGARSHDARREALAAFRAGEVRFLISTDLGARGLDITGLPYVVNMTLPERAEDYIHRVGRVGRADALGLAISLVAAVPEKVWFCTRKGYKPWLKPKRGDVLTNEEGGHTTWYDEMQMLREVEKRLKQEVQALAPDLTLPPDIAAHVGGGSAGSAAYGQSQKREGALAQDVAERLAAVRPAVEELAALERAAQISFFDFKTRFSTQAAVR